jgi:hypothetical protein
MKLDFLARRSHYIDHMAPIYHHLPAQFRGSFHVSADLVEYARSQHIQDIQVFNKSGEFDYVLTCGYGDMTAVTRMKRHKMINMEHGIGHGFGTAAYPNGPGRRDAIDLCLYPNRYTADKALAVRQNEYEIIGTPKMDAMVTTGSWAASTKTICISFHWGNPGQNPPESGTAFEHYKKIIPVLNKKYTLIAHGHPLARDHQKPIYRDMGVEFVDDFMDVCRRASIYINDLSSTMYEFLCTGKPVVVLNAPWFRREVNWGIRFWDYSDVGINVEDPGQLFDAIDQTFENYLICEDARRKAIHDLYPFHGYSAMITADVLVNYMEKNGN